MGAFPEEFRRMLDLLFVALCYELLACVHERTQVHPSELKPAVADAINKILQPVRDHFEHGEAKKLLETVRKFKVTR